MRAIKKLLQKALRMPRKIVIIGMERQSYERIQTAYGVYVWRWGGVEGGRRFLQFEVGGFEKMLLPNRVIQKIKSRSDYKTN